METDKIVLFKGEGIRRQLYHGEYWFVINDVIKAIMGTDDPGHYLIVAKS